MNQIDYYEAKLAFEMDSFDLWDNLNHGAQIVIVDARSAEAFQEEHIPGAISLPHRTMNPESTKDLDKTKLYVSYCDGIGCNASTKGALKLSKLGFKVKELIGGLDWWKRDGYATQGQKAREGKTVPCGC